MKLSNTTIVDKINRFDSHNRNRSIWTIVIGRECDFTKLWVGHNNVLKLKHSDGDRVGKACFFFLIEKDFIPLLF